MPTSFRERYDSAIPSVLGHRHAGAPGYSFESGLDWTEKNNPTKKLKQEEAGEIGRVIESWELWTNSNRAGRVTMKTPWGVTKALHEELIWLAKKLLPWRVSAFHFAAILGKVYGLKGEKLEKFVNAMYSLEANQPQFKVWSGSTASLQAAVAKGFPKGVEEFLRKKKKALNLSEIRGSVAPDSRENVFRSALQLLHNMDLAKREPAEHAQHYALDTWSYSKHEGLPVVKPNPFLNALMTVYAQGGQSVRIGHLVNRGAGHQPTRQELTRGALLAKRLEKLGLLVSENKSAFGSTRRGRRKIGYKLLHLTEKGWRVASTFSENGRRSFSELREIFAS